MLMLVGPVFPDASAALPMVSDAQKDGHDQQRAPRRTMRLGCHLTSGCPPEKTPRPMLAGSNIVASHASLCSYRCLAQV